MADDEWLAKQIELVRQRLRRARAARDQGDANTARAGLDDAMRLLDAVPTDTPAVLTLRCQVFEDLALLCRKLRDPRSAKEYHHRAEEAARTLLREAPGAGARVQLATTLVNLAALYAEQRVFDDGVRYAEEAVTLLRQAQPEVGAAAGFMLVGALQNAGTLHLALGDEERALEHFGSAVELASELAERGAAQILPQLVESTVRYGTLLAQRDRIDEALQVATRTARWAEVACEEGAPAGLAIFVRMQLHLVKLNMARDAFAEAENHLWKAIDTADDINTAAMGTGFYFDLLEKSDEELTAGSLPRDEVIEALDELLDKLEGTDFPGDALLLLRTRKRLWIDGDEGHRAAVAAAAAADEESLSPTARQVLTKLREELAARESGEP